MRVKANFNLHVGPHIFEAGKEYEVEPDRDIERMIQLGRMEVVEEKKESKKK